MLGLVAGSPGKVQGWHRDRLAVVYVRQSSRQQVADHGESTRLQYGLVERAVALGWPRVRVRVIDEDLGRSAAGAQDRPGFRRLVTEISMGRVGLVLGLEMSRLARAGRDWHQLVELCGLSGTLLGDTDGVYDPEEYNDRLLLGLKGTMSEAELHLIKQRMASGRLAKAARGELAVPLPTGYVRRPSGEVAFDPDEQVQAVVRLVFSLFAELGTVHAVLRFLTEHQIQIGIRERAGPAKGEVAWRHAHQTGLVNMLRNPAYAGIYAYGRSRVAVRGGPPRGGRVHTGPEGWLVTIPGLLPAYISVEQYQANLARMAANRARAESLGAVRDGPALLTGLVVCGVCRRRMGVAYEASRTGVVHRYVCQRNHLTYGVGRCQQMAGAFLDAHVVAQVLAALTPAGLELSVQAAECVERRRQEVDHIWRQRLERAEQACVRARRQYQLAEPAGRNRSPSIRPAARNAPSNGSAATPPAPGAFRTSPPVDLRARTRSSSCSTWPADQSTPAGRPSTVPSVVLRAARFGEMLKVAARGPSARYARPGGGRTVPSAAGRDRRWPCKEATSSPTRAVYVAGSWVSRKSTHTRDARNAGRSASLRRTGIVRRCWPATARVSIAAYSSPTHGRDSACGLTTRIPDAEPRMPASRRWASTSPASISHSS
ncbi:Resolvase domain [Parafrankia sp. EAN1pec]|uniref:recombinase family protein n=1 Tax=Parafrankia sp. (strain EAN1pec) TaxID=298653 RepID=UPI000054185D|nr:Resolvase domain [Frankia sp. EAN1pec]